MAIKLQADGTYTVSYHARHPKLKTPISRRRKKIKTKAEAQRIFNSMIVEINDIFKSERVPKWNDLLNEFEQKAGSLGISPMVIQNHMYCLRAHTENAWKEIYVDEIIGQDIRKIIDEKLKDRAPQHKKTVLKYIRKVFQFAFENGYIKQNPTPVMTFLVGDRIKSVLTELQVGKFLQAARDLNSEWYPHWFLAVYSGMRSGELYALTWDKVNFETHKIIVNFAWSSKAGFKSTKSGHDRIVDIAPDLEIFLKELKLKTNDSQYVLPRHRLWTSGDQAREIRQFLIGIGLPPIRFHDLRATWATILLSKGVPPIVVMKMGGWKDMDTMMIYTRMAGIDVEGASKCLEMFDHFQSSGAILTLANRVL